MKNLTHGQQLTINDIIAEFTKLNDNSKVEHRIKLALEDLDKVRTKLGVELLGEDRFDEVWTSLNNIQIALDFNSDEADTWKLSSEVLYVCESDIELTFKELGKQIEYYSLKCYDGYAIGDNGIIEVKLKYPKLKDVSFDNKAKAYKHRYGIDSTFNVESVHYGDIMMFMSELDSFKVL